LLRNSGFLLCIGTDSHASNRSLSILDEMMVISEKCPGILLKEQLGWACLNGAKAMKIDSWAGSIEKGKKPGINLITGIDFKTMRLTAKSKVRKLI